MAERVAAVTALKLRMEEGEAAGKAPATKGRGGVRSSS